MTSACFPRLRWLALAWVAVYDAFVDPILKKTWGGPVTHVAVVAGALVLVAYPLTHALLLRVCPSPPQALTVRRT